MRRLLEKLHIYVGLLNFTILMVFGAAGLHGVLVADPREAQEPPMDARRIDMTIPGDASDKAIADLVHAELGLVTAGRLPEWAIARNDRHELVLTFAGVNGATHVRVLEGEGAIEVSHRPASIGAYLNNLHLTVPVYAPRNPVMLLWSLYVELSIFSLLFMVISGVYLWAVSRPRLWWAQAALAIGTGSFVVLYGLLG